MKKLTAPTVLLFLLCVFVLSAGASAEISVTISHLENVGVGRLVNVPISLDNPPPGLELGGFDLVIQADPALLLYGITPGQLLQNCGWEYFNTSAAPQGSKRIVALAEINNGAHHPSCYAAESGELAVLTFMIPNDSSLMENMAPIRWIWFECGDNAISSKSGWTLYVSRDVYDFDGSDYQLITADSAMPSRFGAPDECLESDTASIVRYVDFYNGAVDVGLVDTIPPTAICPDDMVIPAERDSCSARAFWQAGVSDNNPGAIVFCSPSSGTRFALGEHTVHCYAIDTAGNADTCAFTVTVADTARPAVICPADIVTTNAPGMGGANVSFTVPAWDNCAGVTVFPNPPSGHFFRIGSSEVVVIATDASGNSSGCWFHIIVRDTSAPVLTCPEDITVVADSGECSKVVTFAPTATDNSGRATVVCSPPSGTAFGVGTFPVQVTATDSSGNFTVCEFSVTVLDEERPSIVCPADIHVFNDSGAYGAHVYYSAEADDNCPGVTTYYVPPSGWFFEVGTEEVVAVATDAAGNIRACAFDVTVELDDPDNDGRPGWDDNCPNTANVDQADADDDGIGDVCDECTDTDHDGFGDPGYPANTCALDNCPDTPNAFQTDADDDGIGDVCDDCTDIDKDGFGDPGYPANTCTTDNCPSVANPLQVDSDGDGLGDACCCWEPTVGNLDHSANGEISLGDLTALVDHLFLSLRPVACPSAANIDGDPAGTVSLGDLTALVDHLFIRLEPLPPCP